MAFAPMILMAVSAAVTAVGQIRQAQATSAAANYTAQVADRNALVARQQSEADAHRQRAVSARRLGSIRAAYGASGVTMEGTPLDLLEDSAAQAELDAITTRYKGEVAAIGYEGEAQLARFRAKQARREGNLSAATTLLGAASRMYGGAGGAASSAGSSLAGSGGGAGNYNFGGGY